MGGVHSAGVAECGWCCAGRGCARSNAAGARCARGNTSHPSSGAHCMLLNGLLPLHCMPLNGRVPLLPLQAYAAGGNAAGGDATQLVAPAGSAASGSAAGGGGAAAAAASRTPETGSGASSEAVAGEAGCLPPRGAVTVQYWQACFSLPPQRLLGREHMARTQAATAVGLLLRLCHVMRYPHSWLPMTPGTPPLVPCPSAADQGRGHGPAPQHRPAARCAGGAHAGPGGSRGGRGTAGWVVLDHPAPGRAGERGQGGGGVVGGRERDARAALVCRVLCAALLLLPGPQHGG